MLVLSQRVATVLLLKEKFYEMGELVMKFEIKIEIYIFATLG